MTPTYEQFRKYVFARIDLGSRYFSHGCSLQSDYDLFVQELQAKHPEALKFSRSLRAYFTAKIKKRLT